MNAWPASKLAIAIGLFLSAWCAQAARAEDAESPSWFARTYRCAESNATSPNACLDEVRANSCREFASLPADIQGNIDLQLHCNFLAGEIGGHEETDNRVFQIADELHCGSREAKALELVRKYWTTRAHAEVVLFFPERLNENEAKCLKRSR